MPINQTGAGFHRDSRKEARAVRGARVQFVIYDELQDLICNECGNDNVCEGYLKCSECLEQVGE
jgi:hypothetical protein